MTEQHDHGIFELIEQREWEKIEQLLKIHPELAQGVKPGTKTTTVLHELLKIGSVPRNLIHLCATLAPETIISPEDNYGDTCLHICCRNSQFSHAKLEILLQQLDAKNGLKRTNRLGGTALHSAANHNATLETLSLLIHTCPSILNVRTPERRHVLDVLFEGFLFTIHGHTHILKILNNESPQSSIFDRFWKKVRLIALEAYHQSDRCRASSPSTKQRNADDVYLIHGMLLCGTISDKLLRLALQLTGPDAATAKDRTGNTPLHYYARQYYDDRPHRSEIRALLHPAASCRNDAGFLPLHLAIRDRLPYHDSWGSVKTHAIDPETQLPPALLAASMAGREAINSCFCLLRNHPEQIKPQKRTMVKF